MKKKFYIYNQVFKPFGKKILKKSFFIKFFKIFFQFLKFPVEKFNLKKIMIFKQNKHFVLFFHFPLYFMSPDPVLTEPLIVVAFTSPEPV
jgi:hypothetical protein